MLCYYCPQEADGKHAVKSSALCVLKSVFCVWWADAVQSSKVSLIMVVYCILHTLAPKSSCVMH